MVYDFKKLEEKVGGGVRHFESEIASLRTGRANPALLEEIKIDAYDTSNPLKNVAAINVEDARTLTVQPWDKSLMEAIEKGIRASNLGLNAVVSKDLIRVTLPQLTEERRGQLMKLLKEKLEEARVNIRKARDEVWKEIQDKERAKEISEDEKFRLKEQMEEKIKKGIEKLDEIFAKKEREIKE
ncbi:ribosome recycling factor [Candidatus Giovannonibacteria bacterium]|nr:ribosome recycling factor [Candidatus Giovannonibacteria bacterium]